MGLVFKRELCFDLMWNVTNLLCDFLWGRVIWNSNYEWINFSSALSSVKLNGPLIRSTLQRRVWCPYAPQGIMRSEKETT